MSPRARSPDRNGIPVWVKAGVAAGASAALLVVVLLFSGHGPGQHAAEETNSDTGAPPAEVGHER